MKRQLEQHLSQVSDFDSPSVSLEQYRTPADIAAHLLTLADLQGDIANRIVVDLGSGTGMLAIGAALLQADRVIGLDIDHEAIKLAEANEKTIDPPGTIDWVQAAVNRAPLCAEGFTILSNPPFGAQSGRKHADKRFLETIADLAAVSYTIHNEGSKHFVESFSSDHGGEITHAYEAEFPIGRRFQFHTDQTRTIRTEIFRIDW